MALDTAHSAALDGPVIYPVRFALLDFDGDPLRMTEAPYAVTFGGTGDEDLDGFTFTPLNMQPISVSDVKQNESGADTVTFTLSGINSDPDDLDVMNIIGDRALWQGRLVRLWRAVFSADGAMIGYPDPYFTGYLNVPSFGLTRAGSTIQITAESYLASLTAASNRSYLSQAEYDSGDLSAEASIAIANGIEGRGLTPSIILPDVPWGNLWGNIR